MRGALLAMVVALAPALAVRVAWLSPAPGVYQEGRTLRLEVRVSPDPGERILEVRAVALPSGKWVMDSRPGSGGGVVLRYWDTTGYAGTTALRLEVAYMGGRGDTAYAILPVQIVGAPRGQNLQSQGLVEDLDRLITDACRFISFYDLGSVRWLCTAHRTVKKAIRYFDQLQYMWEDFKSQAMYYGTGLALDWLGKSLGLHQLNPLVDEVDRALDGFMSDIRRQKNAILNALARARQKQLAEIYGWTPDGDPLYWGPEWWAKLISGVVPQLGFQATEQSLKDLQRTAQLLENQSRVAENVQNQQENTKPENVFQDLWDTLGAVWNFISEAIQKGWTSPHRYKRRQRRRGRTPTHGGPGRPSERLHPPGRALRPEQPQRPGGREGRLGQRPHHPRHLRDPYRRGRERALHPGGDGGAGEGLCRDASPGGHEQHAGHPGDAQPGRPAGHDRGAAFPGQPEPGGAHQEAGAKRRGPASPGYGHGGLPGGEDLGQVRGGRGGAGHAGPAVAGGVRPNTGGGP
jgi:hypothetical protein